MQPVVVEIWDFCSKIIILTKGFYYFRLSTFLRDSLKLQPWLRQPSISKMTSTPAFMQITTPLQNGLRWEFTSTFRSSPPTVCATRFCFQRRKYSRNYIYFTPKFCSSCPLKELSQARIKMLKLALIGWFSGFWRVVDKLKFISCLINFELKDYAINAS